MPADLQKARELFLHAVGKLPPEEWGGYVAEACGDDAELLRQVDRLLQVHREAGSFLDRPAAAAGATRDFAPGPEEKAAASPLRERPGTVIGPYKLLQQIGEGGMGAVFMAEQTQPVRRMVALKVIKAGMDSAQVVARFEAERQALAMMDHVNIARVLDAGATESGRPYFVMELVHGVPITKYCDDNQLTPRQRLELFVPVCQAIQHAHQKGVIHRDVKPSNVMVTLYDGKPVPKVIDFGVAKATEQKLTERTLFTQYGAMVGTLEYMSPEQAEMSALGVDTRSDIYSLGVLLYELLTGSTPLTRKRFKDAAYGEILRIIKEEEPPRPSTRLTDSGDALETISARRHMEPAKLAMLVRGELDWIVMKTLEKDRNRRYATANGFAADVQHYLNDEPVLACPPTVGYRFRKFARRNKRMLATAGVLALALIAGAAVSAWQAIRATAAEGLAQTRLQAEAEAQNATRAQLSLTEAAQEKATRRLYDAQVAQARAIRLSGRIGQRFQSLEVLAAATQMARDMNLFEDESLKLRNEAIGCLALPDIKLAKEWPGWPEGSRGLAFDGALERYARLDQQGIVSIRRVADDTELWSLPGMGPDAGASLSPDGQFFALHHPDNRFQVWKLAGKEPVELLNGTGILVFSTDSRQCASSRADGSLWLYELPSGRLVKQLALGVHASSLAFHPRDQQLALSCEKGVQVRDLTTGRILAEFLCNDAEQLAWHPDGETLAVLVAHERTIHICERATLKTIIRLEGSRNDGISFAFNRTGDVLASICWDARLRLWDPRTGLELFSTAGLSLTSLRFSSDKDLLAAGIAGDRLQLWEVGSAPCYRTLLRNNVLGLGSYRSVAIHPEGRLLAVGTYDGADLWDLATGKHLQWIKLAPGTEHILFDPSGALLTNGQDGVLRWPVQVGIPSTELVRVGPPQKLALPGSDGKIARSKDGRVLANAQHNMGSWILHPDGSDQPIRLGPTNVDVRYVAVSPDGRLVATASHIGAPVKVWRLDSSKPESGKLVAELPGPARMVGFSPDGKWLATSMPNCRLWAVDSWQPGPHIGAGTALAFSPDGKLLALETGQGVVRLVDPDTGREYARLEDPNRFPDRATEMGFSPNGTQLVMTNGDSESIHAWDLRAIRGQLAKMGLDWDLPPYPRAEEKKNQPPLQVTVDLGPLAPEAPHQDVLKYSLALAFMPLNPEAYLRRGRAYYQLRQWREAADDLDAALALNPGINDGQVWFELGYASKEAGRSKPAIAAYSRAIELDPQSDGAWNNRGVLGEQLGALDKAAEDFSKAIELNPKNDTAWNNRSRVYAQQGRWDKVVEDCSRFLELVERPRQMEAYYRRAGAYTQLARYREGVADYQKILELAPNSSLAHNDLAWLLANCPDARFRDPVRAAKLAQQAIDHAEQVGNVWNTLGAAHYRAGNWKAAIEALDRSMAFRKGGDAFDFFFLVMAHWQLGHKDEAQKWHEKAVQWMQENEEALKNDKMHAEELRRFQAEAEELLKSEKKAGPK